MVGLDRVVIEGKVERDLKPFSYASVFLIFNENSLILFKNLYKS